jgi:symplekin
MAKLTRAATAKYDTAKIALLVANQVSAKEIPMLLSFLDNLCPPDSSMPTLDLIEACNSIQDRFFQPDGKRDARFIIPVVSGMKRHDLQRKLCDFVAADDNVFKAALYRMSERVTRYALICREESENLHGMSLCEQLVFLHNLDFVSANIPQKRYIDAIGLCLDDVEIFTDRVVMATLDHISNAYLRGDALLPLAYMRSIILTCSKHESLHSWICHTLLPRLIDGKVYNDKRNWEGWMRCANMLEHTAESGVSSIDIIQKLPMEQYHQYRTKYPL